MISRAISTDILRRTLLDFPRAVSARDVPPRHRWRIDDPRSGWKGRGLWINDSNDPARFIEHGTGVVSHI